MINPFCFSWGYTGVTLQVFLTEILLCKLFGKLFQNEFLLDGLKDFLQIACADSTKDV